MTIFAILIDVCPIRPVHLTDLSNLACSMYIRLNATTLAPALPVSILTDLHPEPASCRSRARLGFYLDLHIGA
jgi:hypothetical protein